VEPHEVKEIATAISNISETKIRARIAGLASEDIDIYGGIDYSDDDDIVETLSYISKLKEFYIEAAMNGNAVLHLIS
jgi:diaminopimelate decarboxylase